MAASEAGEQIQTISDVTSKHRRGLGDVGAITSPQLRDGAFARTMLKMGDRAPATVLGNAKGGTTDVGALLKKGLVIVTFYRGGWCPFCNLELKAFQEVLPEILAVGASLVAISPEKPDNTLSTAEKNALSFEVLSDVGH
jgi:peroxiredoxin